MELPHLAQGEGKDNHSEGAAKRILAADFNLCPFAAECRRKWIPEADESGAECGHCGQHLTRDNLYRILSGCL
jgi:hypothetical protein